MSDRGAQPGAGRARRRERAGGGRLPTELERTAAFRTELRRFLHRTDTIARAAGLTAQRYDLLLMIKTAPDAVRTVSQLCDDLDLKQTAVTELVNRSEDAGLVRKTQSTDDRRVVRIALTNDGEKRLMRVYDALADDRHAFIEAFRELSERFHA